MKVKSDGKLFTGGEIVSAEGAPKRADILVMGNGTIECVGLDLPHPDGAKIETIDCKDRLLMPTMFDMHSHACSPGREDREDIGTCSEAAIAGGITGLLLMPDTAQPIDSSGMVQSVLNSAAEQSRIPIQTAGCITRGRAGEELAGIAGMRSGGVQVLTDSDLPVANPLVLRRAMEYARDMGLLIACHCETPELSEDGALHEGAVSYQLGLPGITPISEEICLYRDARLAQYTDCPVHIQQISTAKSMKAVRYFKEQGVDITCEVSPHHLIFCQDDVGDFDTNLKVNPPLRPERDRDQLVAALADGVIDCIATDHSPRTAFEKNMPFGESPFGMVGLETAFVALHHHFVKTGKLDWSTIVRTFSRNPRKCTGAETAEISSGKDAEFMVFDPAGETTFTAETMRSRSSNSPFLGRTLVGRIERVIFGSDDLLEKA